MRKYVRIALSVVAFAFVLCGFWSFAGGDMLEALAFFVLSGIDFVYLKLDRMEQHARPANIVNKPPAIRNHYMTGE